MSTDMNIVIKVSLDTSALRKQAKQLVEFADAIDHQAKHEKVKDVGTVPPELTVPVAPTPTFPAAVPPPPSAPVTTTPPAPLAPPAPPIAPAPPAAPAPHVATDPIELDSRGLPWDERIHSGKKNKLAKTAAWKLKRGVQPLTVDQIEAELRLKYPDPAPTLPAAPVAPAATPAASVAPAATPAAPVAPAATPVSPDSDLYLPLMAKCTKRINANELTLEAIVAVCNKHGVNTIPELAGRPDIIPIVDMEIETIWTQNTLG